MKKLLQQILLMASLFTVNAVANEWDGGKSYAENMKQDMKDKIEKEKQEKEEKKEKEEKEKKEREERKQREEKKDL